MSGHGSFWGHFWLAKLFLQFAGLLPIGGSSCLWKSFLNQFLATLPLWTSFYILIPEFKYIFFQILEPRSLDTCIRVSTNFLIQSPDIDSFLEAVLITISVLTYQLRSIFVVVYRHRITRLFLVCETMWNEAVPADYSVIFIWAKRAKRISTIYFCGAYCSVITFAVTSTVKQLSSAENSTTKYYPFAPEEDSTPTPQYQIKFATQVLISYIGIAYIAACDMTGTILALNMCGQLALIQSWLADVSRENVGTRDQRTDQSLQNVLIKCARRHQIVLDFCSELGDVIRYNYLIQIVTEMYIMAVSGARLSQGSGSVQHLSTLLLAINGLLFSCWPADTLSFQSTEIAQAAYEVPWHRGSSREKTMVAVMIARSQRPATLSAGNFVKLSLQTFSSITSNGLSFCMVLLNI